MLRKRYTKDPADVLDYPNNWSDWLDDGETIYSSTWAVSPSGLSMSMPSIVNNGTYAVVWLAGGVANNIYIVTNRITTTDGRIAERSFNLAIRNL